MTENLLGLRENPFAAGHDLRLIHLTPAREEVLAQLRHWLAGGEPFALVTGEAGIGKTSVVHQVLESEGVSTAFITHPAFSRNELLEEICIRFEVDLPDDSSMPQALARLERHLCKLRAGGEKSVLVIDEAHDLTAELLEELRLLSNLEAQGKPLLQIVLVGLPEIEGRFAQARLAQFRQRISTHCRIGPLTAEETEGYIHHRVTAAGGDGPERFPRESCLEIYRLARGVPRAINTIAGQAILRASREPARSVTPAHVQASAADSWLRTVSEGPPPPKVERPENPPAAKDPSAAPKADRKKDDPDVKAWVSRFVDPTRPLRIGGHSSEDREAAIFRREWAMASEEQPTSPPEAAGSKPGARPGAAKTRRTAPPARATASPAEALIRTLRAPVVLKLAVAVVVGIGAFQLARLSHRPSSNPRAPVAPTAVQPTPAMPDPKPVTSARRKAPSAPIARKTAGAVADSVAPRPPRRRLGIEAGTYINAERARVESATLAELTGLPVRVVEISEDGVPIYQVVLGSFGSRRKASQAADDLLGRGMLEQARVVTLPAEEPTSR